MLFRNQEVQCGSVVEIRVKSRGRSECNDWKGGCQDKVDDYFSIEYCCLSERDVDECFLSAVVLRGTVQRVLLSNALDTRASAVVECEQRYRQQAGGEGGLATAHSTVLFLGQRD